MSDKMGRAGKLARNVLRLIPAAAALFKIGAKNVALTLADEALRVEGIHKQQFKGAAMRGRGFGTARNKRAATKRRAVVRARKLGHA